MVRIFVIVAALLLQDRALADKALALPIVVSTLRLSSLETHRNNQIFLHHQRLGQLDAIFELARQDHETHLLRRVTLARRLEGERYQAVLLYLHEVARHRQDTAFSRTALPDTPITRAQLKTAYQAALEATQKDLTTDRAYDLVTQIESASYGRNW